MSARPPQVVPVRALLAAPTLALLLTGCGSTRREGIVVPALETGVRHYSGTVLTGPRPDATAAERVAPGDAFDVRARVTYLEEMPESELEPLATRTRLVVSSRGDETLLPASRLAIGARIGAGAAARDTVQAARRMGAARAREIVELRGALPEGVTVSLHARSVDLIFRDDLGEVRRMLGVLVSREERDALAVALAVESQDPDASTEADQHIVERQIVLLQDVPRLDGDPLVIAVPSPFDPFGRNTFLIEVTVRRPLDNAAHRNAVARCLEDLRREGEAATEAAAEPVLRDRQLRALAGGLQALDLAEHQRAALVFITSSNRAPLALDLALAADETTLAAWIQTFVRETGGGPMTGEMSGEELAWELDRTAWQYLARRLREEDLPVGLQGVMVLHAGAVGRLALEIEDTLAESADRAEFDAGVLDRNRGFLLSPDPAIRVRAFDWLAARDEAPGGFDPLASRDDRRTALDPYVRVWGRRGGRR